MVAGRRDLVGEVAEPVQGEDLGQPAEGLADDRDRAPVPARPTAVRGPTVTSRGVGELDADDARRRTRRAAAWLALAADLLDDVAAVDRRDPKRQVVAVAVDDEA